MQTNIAEGRVIDAEGIFNMRDVGGLPTRSGKLMRKGMFMRADNLGWLKPAGVDRLRKLNLSTILDLRMSHEIQRDPNPFSGKENPRYLNVDMVGHEVHPEDGDGGDPLWYRRQLADGTLEFPIYAMMRTYCHWLESRSLQIKEVFTLLTDPAAAPAVFHCAGGKDRTGLTAAMLQALAGVPDSEIAADYTITAEYNFVRYRQEAFHGTSIDSAEGYGREFCPSETILMVLFWIRSRFGGVAQYLDSIGVNKSALGALVSRLLC